MKSAGNKKTSILHRLMAAILLIVIGFTLVSCSGQRYGCMKHHYRDVKMGIAH